MTTSKIVGKKKKVRLTVPSRFFQDVPNWFHEVEIKKDNLKT